MATIKEMKNLASRKGWDLKGKKSHADILALIQEYQAKEDIEKANNPPDEVITNDGENVEVTYRLRKEDRTFRTPDGKIRARTIGIVNKDTILRTGRIVSYTDRITGELVKYSDFEDYSQGDKVKIPKGTEVFVLGCNPGGEYYATSFNYRGIGEYKASNPAYIKTEDLTLV